MSIPLIINGTTYSYPETGDVGWGAEATDWAAAVTSGMLQKAGGLFQLLAEVDFGSSYGIKSAYYKSRTSNVAAAGAIRLAHADIVAWRDNANSSDLELGVDSSDNLTFNGNPLIPSTPLTASRAVVTDSGGVLTTSSVTATQIGYLSGAAGTTGTGNLVYSAAPTFTGAVTFSGTVGLTQFTTSGSNRQIILRPSDSSAIGIQYLNAAASGVYNWFAGAQLTTSNTFEITPSTATDGTTFSNPALVLNRTGAVTVPGTLNVTGVTTLTAQPILSSLTASLPVFTDGSKGLVSNTMTGTGSVVMSASPTLTGTIAAAAANFSGTINLAGATASQALFTDGSKNVVSNAITGSGNVVMSASPTLTGTIAAAAANFSGAVNLNTLTASQAVFSDGSKNLVSNAITGSGNVVMSASPTLTGTIGAAAMTLSSTLQVTGVTTLTAQPILSSLTASRPVFTDGSKGLVSNTMTGTGDVVMSASPTLTGTIGAAAMTLSGTLAVTGAATFSNKAGVGGAVDSNSTFSVTSTTAVTGTVTNSAGGTTVTGSGTKFLTDFRVGQTITANGETRTISAVGSDTSLTTDTWTGANSGVTATRAATPFLYQYQNSNFQIGGTRTTPATNFATSALGALFVSDVASAAAAAAAKQQVAMVGYCGAVAGTNSTPAFIIARSGGSEASPAAIASGDELGIIDFRGYGNTLGAAATGARIVATSTQAFSSSASGSKLQFKTVPNSTQTVTTALTLDQDQSATFAGRLIVTNAVTPATAGATGTVGTIAWDSSFIYICVATNTWKRVAIATW